MDARVTAGREDVIGAIRCHRRVLLAAGIGTFAGCLGWADEEPGGDIESAVLEYLEGEDSHSEDGTATATVFSSDEPGGETFHLDVTDRLATPADAEPATLERHVLENAHGIVALVGDREREFTRIEAEVEISESGESWRRIARWHVRIEDYEGVDWDGTDPIELPHLIDVYEFDADGIETDE